LLRTTAKTHRQKRPRFYASRMRAHYSHGKHERKLSSKVSIFKAAAIHDLYSIRVPPTG
jgi:hypothetical protein